MKIQHYGWHPDLPDQRDHLFSVVYGVAAQLPSSVDLRPKCPPIEDQKKLGSCTANALVGALEFLELKDGVTFADLSRLFVYYNERVIENTVSSDSGAQLRDGIKTLAKQGVCPEKMWPYVISKFTNKPTAACYKNAGQHVILSYQRIQSMNEMKTCLAAGYPFVFGFTVYESFESPGVASSGVVPMPAMHEKVVGGHAVVAVGYDDASQRVIVRNSWGASWGQAGYFTMPYEYITNPKLASDMWTIRREEGE